MATASRELKPKLDPDVAWIPYEHDPGVQGLGSDLHPMLPLDPLPQHGLSFHCVQHKRWILVSMERSRKGYFLHPDVTLVACTSFLHWCRYPMMDSTLW